MQTIGRLAGRIVKPDQVQQTMGAMMETLLSRMPVEDRIAFVSAMLPRCLDAMFANLDDAGRERLALAMADRITEAAAPRMADRRDKATDEPQGTTTSALARK
jgi:hypothetical protein